MHNREMTVMMKAYIAKFYEHDGSERLAQALDMNRRSIINLYTKMIQQGELEHWIEIWDKRDVNAPERR